MSRWLLLVSAGVGMTRRIGDISIADGMPELELGRLRVGRATVNGVRHGDMETSLQQGSRVAQSLLFREFGRNRSLANVEVSIEESGVTVTGRSGELPLGLSVFLHLAHRDHLAAVPTYQFAATGTLDPHGNVGSVEDVPARSPPHWRTDFPTAASSFTRAPTTNG